MRGQSGIAGNSATERQSALGMRFDDRHGWVEHVFQRTATFFQSHRKSRFALMRCQTLCLPNTTEKHFAEFQRSENSHVAAFLTPQGSKNPIVKPVPVSCRMLSPHSHTPTSRIDAVLGCPPVAFRVPAFLASVCYASLTIFAGLDLNHRIHHFSDKR